MRLWSIHPGYLDTKGLVALWREGLLAQSILLGNTKGYRNHPQLKRFKISGNPVGTIADYLRCVAEEADRRGFNFNTGKIVNKQTGHKIFVTEGQIEYEFKHLLKKLHERSPDLHDKLLLTTIINIHPTFKKIKGKIEEWEKVL